MKIIIKSGFMFYVEIVFGHNHARANKMKPDNALKILFVYLFLSIQGLNPAFAQGQISETGIEYLSSGIGDDEKAEEISDKYNLKMIFATQGSGEYLADIGIAIEKINGTRILETISPGPHFYVALPPGKYRITAEFKEKAMTRTIAIRNRKRQVSYFHWPEQP